MTDKEAAGRVERELKLSLPDGVAEARVVDALRKAGCAVEALPARELLDTYLDTFDWLLKKDGLTLRYRVVDGKTAEYTIKAIEPVGPGGIAVRKEVTANAGRRSGLPADIGVRKIRIAAERVIAPRRLIEQFSISSTRRPYRAVCPGGEELELAFDEFSFSLLGLAKKRAAKKGRRRTFYEFEAELVKGDSSVLVMISGLLSGEFGFAPSVSSKFLLAFERLGIKPLPVKPPDRYAVRITDRADEAVRKVLSWQMKRLSAQAPGIKEDVDTEFVHQGRVAVRRMRSALNLFKNDVPRGARKFLSGELKWIGGALGAVRDADVFMLNLPELRRRARTKGFGEEEFTGWLLKRRKDALDDLTAAFASPRYSNFKFRMERFLSSPQTGRRGAAAPARIGEAACGLITGRLDAVMAQGAAVMRKPKLKEFHRLRILAKKLRYTCEFFSPALDGRLDPFIERTVEIQDCLGELQDTVFTRALFDEFLAESGGSKGRATARFIKAVCELEERVAEQRRRRFGKIWRRFVSGGAAKELEEGLQGAMPGGPEPLPAGQVEGAVSIRREEGS